MYRAAPLLACLLVATALFAGPVMAQDPAPEARQEASREAAAWAVQAAEESLQEAAAAWAAARRLPLRIEQPGGGVVELVGVVGARPRYLTTLNQHAAMVTHTDQLYPGQPLGLALTGRGLTLGLWDGGHAMDTHPELTGRVTFGDEGAVDDHATHVAGTLAAAGVNPEARGMAYEAGLVSYTWRNDAAELHAEARHGLLVSNHSYGAVAGWFFGDLEGTRSEQWYWAGDPAVSTDEDVDFGRYESEAIQFDQVTFANPYLLCVVAGGNDRRDRGPASGTYRGYDEDQKWQTYSVETHPHPRDGGADGYDTLPGAAVAKNVLTVGSAGVDEAGRFAQPSTFSSFGPTDDGRVKPDLAGYGEGLLSTQPGPSYGRRTGTSMATPNVAGTALLLQQHHAALKGSFMRAATLKGLLLHTAHDVDLPGPDYRTGWGLLDAAAAATQVAASLDNRLALLEASLAEGHTFRKTARREGPGPLRVTLSWTDPPGGLIHVDGPAALDAAQPHLRNDLDLRVIDDETGETYFPFRLDRRAPKQAATTGDNALDPVEQVYLPDAPARSYTLVVSHKHALVNHAAQAFSLLVTGGFDDFIPVAVTHLQASPAADAVALSWQTGFERATGAFVVERAQVTFEPGAGKQIGPYLPVGSVPAGGRSEGVQHYTFRDDHFPAGRYAYRIVFADEAGAHYDAGQVEVNIPPPVQAALLANYPNPFTSETTVVLDLPRSSAVRIEAFDGLGRRVGVLYEGELPAGRNHVPVTTGAWAPGVYVVRASTRDGAVHHPVLRLK